MFISKKKLIKCIEEVKKFNHDYYAKNINESESNNEVILRANAYNGGAIDGTNTTCDMLVSMLKL